jgi:hypothetical protein
MSIRVTFRLALLSAESPLWIFVADTTLFDLAGVQQGLFPKKWTLPEIASLLTEVKLDFLVMYFLKETIEATFSDRSTTTTMNERKKLKNVARMNPSVVLLNGVLTQTHSW